MFIKTTKWFELSFLFIIITKLLPKALFCRYSAKVKNTNRIANGYLFVMIILMCRQFSLLWKEIESLSYERT